MCQLQELNLTWRPLSSYPSHSALGRQGTGVGEDGAQLLSMQPQSHHSTETAQGLRETPKAGVQWAGWGWGWLWSPEPHPGASGSPGVPAAEGGGAALLAG